MAKMNEYRHGLAIQMRMVAELLDHLKFYRMRDACNEAASELDIAK